MICFSSSEGAVEDGEDSQWTGVGEARLVLERAVRADTGFYHCHALNKVGTAPPVTTALVVTRE